MKNISCVYDLAKTIYTIDVPLITACFNGFHARAKKKWNNRNCKNRFFVFFFFFFNLKRESMLSIFYSFVYIFLSRLETFPTASEVVINFNNLIIISNAPDCQQPVD